MPLAEYAAPARWRLPAFAMQDGGTIRRAIPLTETDTETLLDDHIT